MGVGGKDSDGSCVQPRILGSPRRSNSSEGFGCNFHCQTRVGLQCLAYIDSRSRVRGREAVQKITVLHSSPAPDIGFHRDRNPPTPSSCVLLSSKILTQEITKGLKKTFQPKWSVLIVAKPVRKSRAVGALTPFPSLLPTPPSAITMQPGRGRCVNPDRAVVPVAPCYRKAALVTHSPPLPIPGVVSLDQGNWATHLLGKYEVFSTAKTTLSHRDPRSPSSAGKRI